MSFDVNIGRTQPIIKAAANMNNDGGSGGNTGFMMRGKRKKEKESINPFDQDSEIDSFFLISKIPTEKSLEGFQASWFDNLIDKIIK